VRRLIHLLHLRGRRLVGHEGYPCHPFLLSSNSLSRIRKTG
jgi:hypothetical protein